MTSLTLDDAPRGRVLWGHSVDLAGPAPEVLSELVAALSPFEGWVVAWHGLAAWSGSVCVGVNIAVAPESAFDEGEMFDVDPQEVDALMEAAADDVEFSGADVKKARERFDIGRVEVESLLGRLLPGGKLHGPDLWLTTCGDFVISSVGGLKKPVRNSTERMGATSFKLGAKATAFLRCWGYQGD